jgi:hypothetical protein
MLSNYAERRLTFEYIGSSMRGWHARAMSFFLVLVAVSSGTSMLLVVRPEQITSEVAL